LGDGNGMIALRGFRHPPTYHQDRLRQAPTSHFYDVITNGFGAMPSHAEVVTPTTTDRNWKRPRKRAKIRVGRLLLPLQEDMAIDEQ
jgi:hypothetical protein